MDAQQAPKPPNDNLIVHLARCLREDVYYSKDSDIQLRQWPINGDDHDSWDNPTDIEKWYYMAYSILQQTDPKRADDALIDLLATNPDTNSESSKVQSGRARGGLK
jgi:hypothetical protein